MTAESIIIYPSASSGPTTKSVHPPFGGLFLAEALVRSGYSAAILDDSMKSIFSSIRSTISSQIVGVGISTMSGTQLKNAIEIAKFLRTNYPDVPLIWGGAHVTALPGQTLESDLVDYVVWGEGEQSLPQLLDAIEGNRDVATVKGIGYKRNGETFITENMGYTTLDRVFELPYHLVNMENYARRLKIGVSRNFSSWTSRGCPFRCRFCSNSSSVWPNTKMRFHTIEHIISDIQTLVDDYGADCITFSDENFLIDERRLRQICRAIKHNKFDLKFRMSGRTDLLSRLSTDTWDLLKDVGFIAVGAGLESGSQRILDYIGKGITLDQIYDVDEKLTRYGFFKTYNFMTCVPTETKEDIALTLKLIVRLAKTSKYCPYPFGTLYKYIPLPGTELFAEAIEHGFKPPTSIEGWTGFDAVNVSGTRHTVRPWISESFYMDVQKANELIESLNSLYAGRDADSHEIDLKLDEIEKFIKFMER